MKESKSYTFIARACPNKKEGDTKIVFMNRDFEVTGDLYLLGFPFGEKNIDLVVEFKTLSSEG